jgi:anti-sigma B factor antagonist
MSSQATTIERTDDVVVIRVIARDLSDVNSKAVHADVNAAAEQSPALPFILDLANVKFIPSLTLGAMVRLGNAFRSRNQRLMLAGLQPTVRQVMTITKLDRIFEIHDNVDAALKAIRL